MYCTGKLILMFSTSFYRSNSFHHFVKMALTKNPKKRPTAEKLLQVQIYA